ncbi:MAG: Uma2 family endonuclease [Anaerolineae bacterium]|nr:Uma2 family endonuclease [Anaerolineae bacterium]
MVLQQEKHYTVEEFEAIADAPENADRLLELIDGEIVEKVPTEEHGLLSSNIIGPLWVWVQTHRKGRVVVEVRHRTLKDQHNARIPDISYRETNDPPVRKGSVPQMPDFAVEIKSPTDSLKTLREKVRYYLNNGTRLAWIVISEKQIVDVYAPDMEDLLIATDMLDGGDVLPGFTMAVKDIFADPAQA